MVGSKALNFFMFMSTCLILSLVLFCPNDGRVQAVASLEISLETSRVNYAIRENVNVFGNLTAGSELVAGHVSIEVDNSLDTPTVLRAITTGGCAVDSTVEIVDVALWNTTTSNVSHSIEAGGTGPVRIAVRNCGPQPRNALIAVNVFDGSMVSVCANFAEIQDLPPNAYTILYIPFEMPFWACVGEAAVAANVFTALPKNGGTPCCPEEVFIFNVTRLSKTVPSVTPDLYIPSELGWFNSSFVLSPESRGGTYKTYVNGNIGRLVASQNRTFEVESSNVPPRASFGFTPDLPFVNQSVTFDGHYASPEGYGDTIIRYEWNYGDGTPLFVSTARPWAFHTFPQVNTYLVMLNVTDSEGLWSQTTNLVAVSPPLGPTANFTWAVSGSLTIAFDASVSQPGWNGTAHSPIVSYEWDFGDGNTTAVSSPLIMHRFPTNTTYMVTLIVTDTQGLHGNLNQSLPATFLFPSWDINQDSFVNAKDAVTLGSHFGTQAGDSNFLNAADINCDGYINAKDAVILGTHFGEHYG
jgi:hypothetical protein